MIQDRVDGLGVSGAEVVLAGDTIDITVPGVQGDRARSLGQTAQLEFRKVVDAQPVGAGGGAGTAPSVPRVPAPGADPAAAPQGMGVPTESAVLPVAAVTGTPRSAATPGPSRRRSGSRRCTPV